MTKKQLQSQIDELNKKIKYVNARCNIHQSRLDRNDNFLKKLKELNKFDIKDLERLEKLDRKHKEYLDKINYIAKERWQMLKDYLNIEEEDYAVLVEMPRYDGFGGAMFSGKEAVKKTRLVKVKK